MNRLAVVATHPIQYYAPLFRRLTSRRNLDLHVFYGLPGSTTAAAFDPGFGQQVQWDIPLLDGYAHTFVPNESRQPGTDRFQGIVSPSLVKHLVSWSPNAVLIYGWNYEAHLRALRELHGRMPVLFRGDSTLIDPNGRVRSLARRLFLTWVYRHVDLALYVGTHNREYYKWCGVSDDRLAWAPHSIESERFADATGESQLRANAWRRELGISPSSLVTLFAGKLERKKAPDLLLRSFQARGRENEHLLIAGSGELDHDLRLQSKGCRNIHFLGFQNQSQMPVIYKMADIYVQPSRGPGETWGLGVNEAMASSRPVIVSDLVGCAPDLVVPYRTGLTFHSEDAEELSAALAALLEDSNSRNKMATGAAELIQMWSMEEQAARIEDAVELVVSKRRL